MAGKEKENMKRKGTASCWRDGEKVCTCEHEKSNRHTRAMAGGSCHRLCPGHSRSSHGCRLQHRFSAPSVSALQAGSRNGGPAAWIGCEAERSRLTDRSDAAVRDFAVPCRAAPAIDPLRSCGLVPDVARFALARTLVIARLQDDPTSDARQKFHP